MTSRKHKRAFALAQQADQLLAEAKGEADPDRERSLIFAAGRLAGQADALLAPSAFEQWFFQPHIRNSLNLIVGLANGVMFWWDVSDGNYSTAAISLAALVLCARQWKQKEKKK